MVLSAGLIKADFYGSSGSSPGSGLSAEPPRLACNLPAIVSGAKADRVMCPLSVKITALVLLPLVISISNPLFLPSRMVRLVGAEFGEAMAITLFMAMILLNPM